VKSPCGGGNAGRNTLIKIGVDGSLPEWTLHKVRRGSVNDERLHFPTCRNILFNSVSSMDVECNDDVNMSVLYNYAAE